MTTGKLQSSDARRVTLLEQPSRLPATRVERQVLAALAHEGSLSLVAVVDRIAEALYRDELRHGGWAAEIGVVGSAMFRADVQRAVEEAAGELWTIEFPARVTR